MIYLTNEDGSIKASTNGHPMVDPEDGSAHHELDAINGVQVIKDLNTEAGNHRKDKSKYKKIVEAIPQTILDNPTLAAEALVTVAGLDGKMKADLQKVRDEVTANFTTVIGEKDAAIEGLNKSLHLEKIGSQFAKTPSLKRTVLHPDVASATFGTHFSLSDKGTVEAKGHDGNPIYSKTNPGQLASFDESLDILIDTSPIKNDILKAGGGHGDGSHGGGGGGGGDDITTRSSKQNITEGLKKLRK